MTSRFRQALAAGAAILLFAGCAGSEDAPTQTEPTSSVAAGETSSSSPSEPTSEPPAEPAAPVPPVEGAYPGAGGPRPAEAEALPTYSRYGVTRAHLLSPTGGIGCDFASGSAGGNEGGCMVKAYWDSELYGCEMLAGACKPRVYFSFDTGQVTEPRGMTGTAGFMQGSHPSYYTVPTIDYGRVVYFEDWTCASAMNGMTCWNTETGSGVFLSRERSERFEGPGGGAAPAGAGQQAPTGGGNSGGGEVVLGSLPPNGDGYGVSRPAMIYNGASMTGMMEDVTWSEWGGEQARGTGQGVNTTGEQMNGAPRNYPINLVAFDIGTCDGKRAYRKLAVFRQGGTFDPSTANDVCWTEQ